MAKLIFKTVKIAGFTLGVLLAVLIIFLGLVWSQYGGEYISRVLLWQETDVGDYLNNFPDRLLTASPTPFISTEASGSDMAESLSKVLSTNDLESFLESSDTQALIVIKDGSIAYEEYFNGYQRDSRLTSFSVAKSVVSTLVGIAIDEGHINSVDDPITRYLPELVERDERFAKITIRDLLMMSSGLRYEEVRPMLFNGDDPLTSYYPDQREAALEFTNISHSPGILFSYNKYHPQLLGMILERSTDMSVTEYTQDRLWDPLGMEFDGSWSLDSEQSGFEKLEAGLNARAIDYAKLGQLFLQEGDWEGTQIVSADWVQEATSVDPSALGDGYYSDEFGKEIYADGDGYYKYMWYGLFRRAEFEDSTPYDFAAQGDHGQFIYVSPSKELVIVRNGEEYGDVDWMGAFYELASLIP